jgi:glucose-6-phosphate isomerase
MSQTNMELWDRYRKYIVTVPSVGMSVDVSRVRFPEGYFANMSAAMSSAFDSMNALEAGSIANRDDNRMVGHYWLRAPNLAPTREVTSAISGTVEKILAFAKQMHMVVHFRHLIHVGIGGSSLGSQFVCSALQTNHDFLTIDFLDNADPDSIDTIVSHLEVELDEALISVVSKSGVTPTPKYVELELERAFQRRGLRFAEHAIATTVPGSPLDITAKSEHWLARFPIWDWVGGRTSVTSAVGLLPAALQGVDIRAFLAGAEAMDVATRSRDPLTNPAASLALMWFWLGKGHGAKNMVVLPYKDCFGFLSRYIQQLVMESIGKKLDRSGLTVEQGLTVYGNKGSTDQHAYLQQLRGGPNDFFTVFIHVQKDRSIPANGISSDLTLGDYLFGSLEGTRNALYELGRDSITITLSEVSARTVGGLVALFERAVGLYAELINVNAYHQPGVDKFVADNVAALQLLICSHLKSANVPQTADQIATAIDRLEEVETVHKLLVRLASDPRRGLHSTEMQNCFERCFWLGTENLNSDRFA